MNLTTKKQFEACLSLSSENHYLASYNGLHFNSVFQPIFDTSLEIVGVEALVRIKDRWGNPIRPDLYFNSDEIDIDEKIDVERLTRVIHIRNFSVSQYRKKKLFLNVLPAAGEFFADDSETSRLLARRLQELRIDPEQIVMELVEIESQNTKLLNHGLTKLKDDGFKVAIDDFGARASTEERVRLINPSILKLDRGLLLDYMNGDKAALLHGISLAKEVGAQTVVEGIETKEQLDAMLELPIDMFQGYFLAMPEAMTPELKAAI